MTTLREIRSSRFFKAALQLIFSFALAFIFLMSIRAALGVENPLFVVSSGSMYPTLRIGDLIVVQKATPAQLEIGDIVVFKDPRARIRAPIVHRIVDIIVDENGNYKIATSGDAIGVGLDQFSPWDASFLIGKVIMRIPYIGNLYLPFLSEENAIIRNGFIIVVLIIIILIFLFTNRGEKGPQKRVLGSYAFLIYVLIVNLSLACLLFLSLWGWGNYSGMLGEYQLYVERYGGENVLLTVGFMTYRIDLLIYGNIRGGVLTFSWFQFFLLALTLFNIFEIIIPYARSRLKRISFL